MMIGIPIYTTYSLEFVEEHVINKDLFTRMYGYPSTRVNLVYVVLN